ncbi:hypothetical protein EI42_06114 [Thermosporothrix hazakensis]|jgi:hypothetical protein|uniref:ABC-2 type transport system permease protein n=1 Tax=Thermosporothrix hazakensis TaxID=644383 RepID=A0A326TSJ9_THEHA|nr:hypothetical protein [Thermosporothrix hazakensis]PZW19360.1 hypothetical protein EI42_06114 [Thermosporothrix hazakensis]GCE49889.1 hypothetical protein KTH_47580 [Thermosporothrix hazakensis]
MKVSRRLGAVRAPTLSLLLGAQFRLAWYHLRVMRWYVLFLVLLGFVGAALVLRLMVWIHYPLIYQYELCRFVLEAGAGLIACMLGSTVLVNDPALELLIASRVGCWKIILGRVLLIWLILGVMNACFVGWTYALGLHYSSSDTPWRLFCMWFVPTWLFTLLALIASLFSRHSAMGGVLGALLLLLELLMKDFFLNYTVLLPFFVPLSIWFPDSSIWWSSRALLFGIGILIAIGVRLRIRRDEALLSAIPL